MTDIEIAHFESRKLKPIQSIANDLGIGHIIEQYGSMKAKIDYERLSDGPDGKLILVTAMTPTKAGEGKTTVSIGLADALNLIGKRSVLALREPSLGPVFGMKGGATGGGYAQIYPMQDINLHFTGDFHAITCANNLLCAMIDNHIYQGNALDIDEDKIFFQRCMDMNDRALRKVTVAQTMRREMPRTDSFVITAASEIMAIMCLAENLDDLKERCGNIMVALNHHGDPIYARQLNVQDAMAIILKDAIRPNLVQTLAGTPAVVHCGPFANVAHGCNSIIATRTALRLGDYAVTEAGFGADLGAEKFLDIKCQISKLKPDAVVMVATVRALKLHGGVPYDDISIPNEDAVLRGLDNLKRHIANITDVYHLPCVVAINKFSTDTDGEIDLIKSELNAVGIKAVQCDVWAKGGTGAVHLAEAVCALCDEPNDYTPCYSLDTDATEKIDSVCRRIYGASGVIYSAQAEQNLDTIRHLGYGHLPVVIAKTQYSFSDDATKLNAPIDFDITIQDLQLRTGCGFIVAKAGKIELMPGLGKTPACVGMSISSDGEISGLF